MSTGAGIIWSTVILVLALLIGAVIWMFTQNTGHPPAPHMAGNTAQQQPLYPPANQNWQQQQAQQQVQQQYQQAPATSVAAPMEAVSTLDAISLGMSILDVTMQKGAPIKETEPAPDPTGARKAMYFLGDDGSDRLTYAILRGPVASLAVTDVCTNILGIKILGIGVNTKQTEVTQKLGEPPVVSINSKGTRKTTTYPQWDVAFEFERGKVIELCITSRPEMRYKQEYKKR